MSVSTLIHRLINILIVSVPLFLCILTAVLLCLSVMRSKRASLLREWISALTRPFFDVTDPLTVSENWKSVRQHWLLSTIETIFGTWRFITLPYILLVGVTMMVSASYTLTRLVGAVILAPAIIRVLVTVLPVRGDRYDSSVLTNNLANRNRLIMINEFVTSLIVNLLYTGSLVLVLLFDKNVF